jgi:trigger factor
MKTSVEPLEGNKVKLSVEVDEDEFERALDAAFKRIAREVRIPGFRPGKAPRRILEARLGSEAGRQEALREALPDYYAKALAESEVDAIAPPEIDITAGQDSGSVAFDAVVEVRPQVSVAGYGGLQVTVPSPEVTDQEIDAQIDRLRGQFGELQPVSRPARKGDFLTVSITATTEGMEEPIYQTDDELYEVGSGAIVPEVDAELDGAKAGDILKFTAKLNEDRTASFTVMVKENKEKILPAVTDEWAAEASEFESVEELRADLRQRLATMKRVQAQIALRNQALDALIQLVEEDAPEPLVNSEIERRVHDLSHRLSSQGADIGQYLQATGQTEQELIDEMRTSATEAVKADLALRSVAQAEGIEATDEEVDAEIARLAERMGQKPDRLRKELERADQVPAVRSDIKKGKALEWLVDRVEIVDDEGQPIDRALLAAPEAPTETAPEELAEASAEEPAQPDNETETEAEQA